MINVSKSTSNTTQPPTAPSQKTNKEKDKKIIDLLILKVVNTSMNVGNSQIQ